MEVASLLDINNYDGLDTLGHVGLSVAVSSVSYAAGLSRPVTGGRRSRVTYRKSVHIGSVSAHGGLRTIILGEADGPELSIM